MTDGPHVKHDLILHFDRVLTEAEWRTLVNYIAAGEVKPARMEAHAHFGTPTESFPAIYTNALRQMYEEAREAFFTSVNLPMLDGEAQAFVRNLAAAIGEISPEEARDALEKFLAERAGR